MWQGRLPREILRNVRESYVMRESSFLHKEMPEESIDCGLGTNPLGLHPVIRTCLGQAQSWDPADYPSPDCHTLRERLSHYLGEDDVSPDEIVVGHGSIDILLHVLRLLLPPGSMMSGISPQFTDVPLQATLTNIRYHPVILRPPHFDPSLAMWTRALATHPHLLYIDRPHNPTGYALSLDDISQLCDQAIRANCWVVVDEAYGDYLPPSEWATRLHFPNLIVTRSFSKAWGLAGARVGYGVLRDADLLSVFRKTQPPFAVSTPGLFLAETALQDTSFLQTTQDYVRTAKKAILDALKGHAFLEAAPTDPRTPILLLFGARGNLYEFLAHRGISTEAGPGYMDLNEHAVRMRVPPPNKLAALLDRLPEIGKIAGGELPEEMSKT